MSKAATLIATLSVSGDMSASVTYSFTNSNSPCGGITPFTVQPGTNYTINVPAGTKGVLVRAPQGAVLPKFLGFSTADAGLSFNTGFAAVSGWDPTVQTTIAIRVGAGSAAETLDLQWL